MKPWEQYQRPPDPTTVATNAAAAGTQNPIAQRMAGTVATVTSTPVGALGTTAGATYLSSTVANASTDSPEVGGLAWLVTFIFQGVKQLDIIDQNRHQWFLLPIISLIVGFVAWEFATKGDWIAALSKAVSNAGSMAFSSAAYYKSAKPLGVFGPAINVQQGEIAPGMPPTPSGLILPGGQ